MRQTKPTLASALLTCLCLLSSHWISPAKGAEPVPTSLQPQNRSLQAVGTLRVPSSKWIDGRKVHHFEDCSATLVATGRRPIIVTAWHCLEDYDDLSRPIRFSVTLDSGEILMREARRLADGGGMHADWAVLQLTAPVYKVTPLRAHPGAADPHREISLAGFVRGGGEDGSNRTLSHDPSCRILSQGATSSDTDCRAVKGASGGAVIQRGASGLPYLCGVVSRGDGRRLSIFVPIDSFRSELNRYL
ncbi:MAG: serine protease [Pseudomonadota bacterium]